MEAPAPVNSENPAGLPAHVPQNTSQQRAVRRMVAVFAALLLAALLIIAVLATRLADAGASVADDRTVTVSGEATLKAVPDQYVFYPTYTITNSDKDAALKELSKKSDELVAGLKKAGVPENSIKTNSNGYDMPGPVKPPVGGSTYYLQLTVTVGDKTLAQKTQDYLVGTSPSGSVSPQTSFSDVKRRQLESQARDQATKDARSKADQSAKNLGFKVGKVKSVSDGNGFGGIRPLDSKAVAPMSAEGSASGGAGSATVSPALGVQPGENELSYSVTVVYEIR